MKTKYAEDKMVRKEAGYAARRNARESLIQLFYEMEIQQDHSRTIKERFENAIDKNNPFDAAYFNRVYDTWTLNRSVIDSMLSESSIHWKLDRIAKVDLAVLRISAMEIIYFEDIPDSVSINEAVELAKKYGTEDSGKFVNGILGRVARGKNIE
jgi:N utilization substance protein B